MYVNEWSRGTSTGVVVTFEGVLQQDVYGTL